MEALNLNSLKVDAQGRVSFSGLSSGIDFQATVDAIMAARRIPVDTLEARITGNEDKIAAYGDLRTLLSTLKESLRNIHGAVSVGNATNAFKSKAAFATTSRTDGAAPAAAGNLLGVSVANGAALGNHSLEIRRVAAAHKVASDTFASAATALGFTGTYTVNGQSITIAATDTLQDVRDRINNANTGANATGVTASIVTISASQNVLVLTADTTGTSMTLANTSGTPLDSLGLLDGADAIKNELQAAATARFTADGLVDVDRFESDKLSGSSVPLSTLAPGVTYPASFTITVNGDTVTVNNIQSTDTLTDLSDDINTAIQASSGATKAAGTAASIVADGNGVRLVITNTSTEAITLGDTSGLLDALGVDNNLIIERTTNTVSDLFTGVTLTLFQAEEGTTVGIDIDRDLSSVRSQIADFVEAYNAAKVFLNTHSYVDPTTGEKTDATGVLFGSSTLTALEQRLGELIGRGAIGVSADFTVLAQIGIDFVDNDSLDDPLLADTLEIDDATLDAALLNNPADVERLFAFDFSSSDPRVSLLGFNGQTAYDASGYVLNIGGVGPAQQSSKSVTSKTAEISDAVNSIGATGTGSITINGTSISYDADGVGGDDDTLETLATKITNAGITGVTASAVSDGGSGFKLQINTSTQTKLDIVNVAGDLLSSLALVTDSYLVGSANIGGNADGSEDLTATVSGNTITVNELGGAEGLKVLYSGDSDLSGVQLDFTIGMGADIFNAIDAMLNVTTGSVTSAVTALEDQNELNSDRVEQMEVRLDLQRQQLLDKFVAMEAALSELQRIRDSISQITTAIFADR